MCVCKKEKCTSWSFYKSFFLPLQSQLVAHQFLEYQMVSSVSREKWINKKFKPTPPNTKKKSTRLHLWISEKLRNTWIYGKKRNSHHEIYPEEQIFNHFMFHIPLQTKCWCSKFYISKQISLKKKLKLKKYKLQNFLQLRKYLSKNITKMSS